MIKMIIPIVMIVVSNCLYHICSKSIPGYVNAFGGLMITYLTGALFSGLLFVYMAKPENAIMELAKVNWASIVLGLAIVGLEAGYVYAYRAGWQINNAPLVANTLLAIALLFIGALVFREGISLKQIFGMIFCIIGLIFINI